jgi:hypothetical protein
VQQKISIGRRRNGGAAAAKGGGPLTKESFHSPFLETAARYSLVNPKEFPWRREMSRANRTTAFARRNNFCSGVPLGRVAEKLIERQRKFLHRTIDHRGSPRNKCNREEAGSHATARGAMDAFATIDFMSVLRCSAVWLSAARKPVGGRPVQRGGRRERPVDITPRSSDGLRSRAWTNRTSSLVLPPTPSILNAGLRKKSFGSFERMSMLTIKCVNDSRIR